MPNEIETKVFRNANYTQRNYNCTNVIACTTEDGNYPNIPGNWQEDENFDVRTLTQLHAIGNARVYGYL